jgi:hypothetical protein
MIDPKRRREPDMESLGWTDRAAHRLGMSSRTEFVGACLLLGLLLGFKLLNTARYKFDTDESQHLHVIWGWARGFVQYRDLCDNHMPLFQILFAPVYGLLGDRPTILYWMRFILLPLYGVVAWCTYRIGALLFSRRVGIWAVILAGFYPGYHFCSLEFRTDNLWAPLWALSIVVLLENGFTPRSASTAGILMGLCFAVSMKTTLLLSSVLLSAALSIYFVSPKKLGLRPRQLASVVALYLGTVLLIPAIIICAFVYRGVWPAFRYWVFDNNILPGLRNHPAWWIVIFPLTFPLTVATAALIAKRAPNDLLALRRVFIFLIWGSYVPALWSFWPLVTRHDYLPYQPLAFALYSALLLLVSDWLSARYPGVILRHLIKPAPVAIGFFLVALLAHPFWVDGTKPETELLRSTIALTDPGDFVLDQKGETIFRQRCFGPIWEPLVVERIRRGIMPDNAAERCIETRTCVATKEKDMSVLATRFVERYFVPVGSRLYVAGAFLSPSPANHGVFDFETAIPVAYTIVAQNAVPIRGWLDGTPYTGGSRMLLPGWHSLRQDANPGPLAAVWAQAVDRGFVPFARTPPPHA